MLPDATAVANVSTWLTYGNTQFPAVSVGIAAIIMVGLLILGARAVNRVFGRR